MRAKIRPLNIATEFNSNDIKLSPIQEKILHEIHKKNSMVNILRSPANIGKTFLCAVLFAIYCVEYSSVGETNFIVTYDARSFANTISGLLKTIFKALGEDVRLHERTTSVKLSNGSSLSYISSCSPEPESKTRGCNVSFIFIDELSKIDGKLFYALLSRLRNNPHRKVIATTNADNMVSGLDFNWVYEQFFRDDKYKNIDPKYLNIIRLGQEHAYVSKEKMQDYHNMMKTFLPTHLISNFISDEFSQPSDLIYYELLDPLNSVVINEHDELKYTEFRCGIDYGYGHRCGIVLSTHTGREEDPIIILDAYAKSKMVVIDIYNLLLKWSSLYGFTLNELEIAVDPSAPLIIDELARLGLTTGKAYNKVDYGITILNLLAKKRLLKIHNRCTDLLAELSGFNHIKRSRKINDDLCDALRYCVSTYYEWLGRTISYNTTNELFESLFR